MDCFCPDCGADYAKAEAIKSKGKAEPIVVTAGNDTEESFFEINDTVIPVKDPGFEKIVCLTALPAMLVQITGFLAGMQRIVFDMPVHEMGHAVTAGYASLIPSPPCGSRSVRGKEAKFPRLRCWQHH